VNTLGGSKGKRPQIGLNSSFRFGGIRIARKYTVGRGVVNMGQIGGLRTNLATFSFTQDVAPNEPRSQYTVGMPGAGNIISSVDLFINIRDLADVLVVSEYGEWRHRLGPRLGHSGKVILCVEKNLQLKMYCVALSESSTGFGVRCPELFFFLGPQNDKLFTANQIIYLGRSLQLII
jgi:hypothetical protein